jgi:hypothetical protein
VQSAHIQSLDALGLFPAIRAWRVLFALLLLLFALQRRKLSRPTHTLLKKGGQLFIANRYFHTGRPVGIFLGE